MTDAAPIPSQPPLTLTPGASPEAQALLDRWNTQWPGVQPWRSEPREQRPDAWVRFHTLTDGRQLVRHRRDARTVRRRFRRIVRAVEYLTGLPATVLLVAVTPWQGALRDRALSVLPALDVWVTHQPLDDDDELDWQAQDQEDEDEWPPSTHSFRAGPVDDRLLSALVLLVHEQDEDFILLSEDLSWAVSAYDGGVDVVMRNPDEATALAEWFSPWLPPHRWPGLHAWSRRPTPREMHRGFGISGIDSEDENEDAELVPEASYRV